MATVKVKLRLSSVTGMGYTSEQTTQIYLTMLEYSMIDDANQGLIRSLLE